MKRSLIAAAAVAFFSWAPVASASTDYSAAIQLQGGLPALRTGNPNLDGPQSLAGEWTTGSDPRAKGFTRGLEADGAWGGWQGNSDMHRAGGPPNSMGEAIGRSVAASGTGASADSQVGMTGLSSRGSVDAVGQAEVDSVARWSRGFSLDAGATMTFAALCTLNILGDDAPLDAMSRFDYDPLGSFASLVLADSAERVRTQLTAQVTSLFGGDWSNVFSYSIGPSGLMSLTVTNNTSERMTGTLGAASYVQVSAPVPEPETLLMMVVGLGAVGAVARRRANRVSLTSK